MAAWRIGSYVVSGWNAGLHQDEESGLWKARVPNTRTVTMGDKWQLQLQGKGKRRLQAAGGKKVRGETAFGQPGIGPA